MPRSRTDHPWTKRLLDALSDGEWHDYREMVREASQEVPEELAEERANYYRNYHYKRIGLSPADRRYGGREETIKTGQRFVVSKIIQALAKSQVVQIQYDSQTTGRTRKRPQKIRLTPGK